MVLIYWLITIWLLNFHFLFYFIFITYKIKDIKFNPQKTQIMVINSKKEVKCTLCNKEIEWVKSLKYLGVTVTQNNKSNTHLQERRLATWRSYYALKSEIEVEGEDLDQKIKSQLFRTYIRPIMYYGLENCFINKTETKKFQTFEGIIMKRMIGVKKRTNTKNLICSLDIEPVDLKIKKSSLHL